MCKNSVSDVLVFEQISALSRSEGADINDRNEMEKIIHQTVVHKNNLRVYNSFITDKSTDYIFVFGSNLAGKHGKGGAHFALKNKGAIYGQAVGLQGNAYAIPTKDENLRTLDLFRIRLYIVDFILFAFENTELKFQVTRVGCGLAGYNDHHIAPLFKGAPDNCYFDPLWQEFL